MRYRVLDTPTGPFALCEEPDGSLRAWWVRLDDPGATLDEGDLDDGNLDETIQPELCRLVERYFAGEAVDFSAAPTPTNTKKGRDRGNAPEFFVRCWEACREIPRGETRTYGELAVLAGSGSGAARAAGGAMRNNPLPIIVPCHRVVAAGERLGGFSGSDDPAGWALSVKRWLLNMERAVYFDADEPLLFEGATLQSP